jgi:hypothetical protein
VILSKFWTRFVFFPSYGNVETKKILGDEQGCLSEQAVYMHDTRHMSAAMAASAAMTPVVEAAAAARHYQQLWVR